MDGFLDDSKWWLPSSYSTYADQVDNLWAVIFWITMITLVVVEALIVYFCVKYRRREGQKALYTHGSHKLEVFWTVATAAILVVLFMMSGTTWAKMKGSFPEDIGLEVKVTGRQFSWYFAYGGPDGELGTADDIRSVPAELGPSDINERELYVPVDTNILCHLTSLDVIHSFFLPHMRMKQDTVPGIFGKVWFNVTEPSDPGPDGQYGTADDTPYPIVCAELCGQGHYRMYGKLFVLPKDEFRRWYAARLEEKAGP